MCREAGTSLGERVRMRQSSGKRHKSGGARKPTHFERSEEAPSAPMRAIREGKGNGPIETRERDHIVPERGRMGQKRRRRGERVRGREAAERRGALLRG